MRWSGMSKAVVGALLSAALLLVACGDGDDGQSPATQVESEASADGSASPSSDEEEPSSGDRGNGGSSGDGTAPPPPVKKIEVPPVPDGGDDSIQTFGEEASAAESAAVAAAIRGWVEAQLDEDWPRVCSYLAPGVTESLATIAERAGGPTDCESLVENLSGSKRALRPLAKLKVGSVRVEGDRGFVLFKMQGDWYAMPVARADDQWRVASLAPVPL